MVHRSNGKGQSGVVSTAKPIILALLAISSEVNSEEQTVNAYGILVSSTGSKTWL